MIEIAEGDSRIAMLVNDIGYEHARPIGWRNPRVSIDWRHPANKHVTQIKLVANDTMRPAIFTREWASFLPQSHLGRDDFTEGI